MIPAGLPSLLKLGQVARVLGMAERTVKGWIDRGALPHVQPSGTRGGRYIPASAVADFAARHGLYLYWEKLL